MSFEVDRYSSAWAHIALYADLTWAAEPPDDFIIANQETLSQSVLFCWQRLWAQHCRVSQVLQDATEETSSQGNNQCELTEKRSSSSQTQENGSNSGKKSVKDVIPESRLAQFYGNFYYDEAREKCYTSTNEKSNGRGYSGQGCENSDLTECWMLPEFKMAPHTGSATPEQIDTLLDFLQEHRDLARGRLRSIEGKVEAKRLWSELCNTLNSMGGCTKTVQQWQKVWADKKHLAKKAAADSRRSASATGGGPSTAPQLSQWELRIMAIMGEGFGERQTGARVPAFQVEYWFRKLVDDPAERNVFPRRRRQYRMLADDDLKVNGHRSAASERWGLAGAEEEAALAAKVKAVRGLWAPRAASPPPQQRKIRARRRQPRRIAALAPPPPAYCIDVPAQLCCDPKCKFKFDPPRPLQLTDHQHTIGRLSASVQAVMRASVARCQPYRGTNVSRYAPTSQRPARHGVWWPRDHPSPRLERYQLTHVSQQEVKTKKPPEEKKETVPEEKDEKSVSISSEQKEEKQTEPEIQKEEEPEKADSPKTQKEKVVVDAQQPSTSAAAAANAAMEAAGLRKKRLYSTVLSMSAPSPINLASAVRLSQKLTPALLKLNPKIVLQSRGRPPNVDHKFEELEKEALEQYKASDESIDTKFRELEKQAVEQYSTSNSNTSCSSGNSAEKRASSSPLVPENDTKKKQTAKFHKGSVVIYSQNFPDLNSSTKGQTSSVTNLKNFHTPPRGEKKEQTHRSNKSRSVKMETHRAASDTDETKGSHKGPMRWTLHVVPPKKRHLTLCVSDCSSDEELDEGGGSIKDAGPCAKGPGGKMKMSAHGGGDLHPIMRKT